MYIAMLLLLLVIIGIVALALMKKSSLPNKGKFNFPIFVIIIAIIHFLFTWVIFGFLFATGEGGEVSGNPLLVMLGILEGILLFFVGIVRHIDKLYYAKVGNGLPNFVYFPLSFIVNSLIWGVVIAWIIRKINSKKTNPTKP